MKKRSFYKIRNRILKINEKDIKKIDDIKYSPFIEKIFQSFYKLSRYKKNIN